MHSQIRLYINAFIFWCVAFWTRGKIFHHYRRLGGTIILRTVSSALAEKHTSVFAWRNEKSFLSSNLCPSVRVRFKNRSLGLKWTEISKKKSFTAVFNITEQVREAVVVLGGGSFPRLVGLKDASFWRFPSPWSHGCVLRSDSSSHRPSKASPPRAGLLASAPLWVPEMSSEARSITASLLQGEFTSVHPPAADTQRTMCWHHLKFSPGP